MGGPGNPGDQVLMTNQLHQSAFRNPYSFRTKTLTAHCFKAHKERERESCLLGSCQTKTDLYWLRNHVKVLGEREILASLVALKRYSIGEMIRKENEKKTKVKVPVKKKKNKTPTHISVSWDEAAMKPGEHVDLV